jgi:hypothetical protein
MIHLSQRDPEWAGKTIGKSTSLIGAYGCTITCISMLSDYFKCYYNPAWMAKNLSFLIDKVIWNSITEKLCFKFIWRFYNYQENRILEALKNPKTAVIFEIKKRHWVVGIRKSIYPWSKWYKVVDPWTGKYNWVNAVDISGGTTFIKN